MIFMLVLYVDFLVKDLKILLLWNVIFVRDGKVFFMKLMMFL